MGVDHKLIDPLILSLKRPIKVDNIKAVYLVDFLIWIVLTRVKIRPTYKSFNMCFVHLFNCKPLILVVGAIVGLGSYVFLVYCLGHRMVSVEY